MRPHIFDLAAPLLFGFACQASAPLNEPPMQGVSAETSSDLSVFIRVIEHIRGAESAEKIALASDVFIPDVSLRDRSPERHSPAVIRQLWKKTWIDPPSPGDSLVDVRLGLPITLESGARVKVLPSNRRKGVSLPDALAAIPESSAVPAQIAIDVTVTTPCLGNCRFPNTVSYRYFLSEDPDGGHTVVTRWPSGAT